MRRSSFLSLLLVGLLGCGGAHDPEYTQTLDGGVLGAKARIASTAMGVDDSGAPVLAYTLELGHTFFVQTLTARSGFTVDAEAVLAPSFNAGGSTVTGAADQGSYVYDRAKGTGRWVDYVEPVGASGDTILWQRWDGALSVENAVTGERTDVPLTVRDRTYDLVLDFRNGRILFQKDLAPGTLSAQIATQVVALDGTVLATLATPTGTTQTWATRLDNAGAVAGVVVEPETHQPVRWDATGAPTLLPGKGLRVAGLLDDGRVIVGPDYAKGTMGLLSAAGSTDLGIRVNGRQTGHVEGGYLFLEQDLPSSAAAYRLPVP